MKQKISKISYKNQKRQVKYTEISYYMMQKSRKNKEKGDNTGEEKRRGRASRAARNGT